MNAYLHHVSGFFAQREEAESTLATLVSQGLPRVQMKIFVTGSTSSSPAEEVKSDGALQDMLVDGAIGTAVGTGVGALGSVALAATSLTLFVASPVVAPLMLLGWGASIGGLIGVAAGATAGEGNKKGWFSDLVADAIANGHVVLVVETRNEQEAITARTVIQASVGEYKEAQAMA
ncbi:hypothetical protein [Marinospirillum alkaliphilum]|uniref:Heat induced stress protein YflT n=1 Tax=Marinospirillum alkaliphilum DSM 21637 TaxID=1122209 RepID=A0A1K2A202_9GAMM|nr:hypothetical protein [Marinospirillum alkaliphilum]SFX80075.1 hypothetical protein SAMN02745752_02926 [Marinospirillum alkaliphilum DSM 21637]